MMSNVDLYAVVQELQMIQDGFIQNVYEYSDNRLLLKLRTKEGKKMLFIDPKKRIHLTEYRYPVPKFPSQFCMTLRKYMKKRRITRVYQHNLDRILIIELLNSEGNDWKFLVELFAGGNYFLLDEEDKIFLAKRYKILKNRRILARQPYDFPPARGVDIQDLTSSQFKDIVQKSGQDLVRTIARGFNLGGDYAEEVCARIGRDKNTPVGELNAVDLEKIFKELKQLNERLVNANFSPVIVLDTDQQPFNVLPFPLEKFGDSSVKEFESFNDALDEYFGKFDVDTLKEMQTKEIRQTLSKQERILQMQEQTIQENKEASKRNQNIGETIFNNVLDLQELINTVNQARKEGGLSWEDIKKRLTKGKEMGIKSAQLFENFKPAQLEVIVKLGDFRISISLNSNIYDLANTYFQKSKKSRKKIDGAKEAIEQTKKRIRKEEASAERVEASLTGLLRSRKKKWYEKFRWFHTSDGFLVIAGRDAGSNESIVKKYMEKSDIFFHADVKGAPVCIIKNPDGMEIPENTIKEAATFAGCYSRAWKFGWGDMKIYYVSPSQVSKTPPSGEFLPKGSFSITGKKNIIPSIYLKTAVGLLFEHIPKEAEEEEDEYLRYVIGGPESAIRAKTKNYVVVRPQKTGQKSGNLAKKIKSIFFSKIEEDMKKWVDLLPIDSIVLFLPPGLSVIS